MILKPSDFNHKLAETTHKQLVDVRMTGETSGAMLAEAKIITYDTIDFDQRVQKENKDLPIFIYCRSGKRSLKAMEVMKKLDFKEVYLLEGGIEAWQADGLPVVHPSKAFWNKMFGEDEYLYGTEPNEFLKSTLDTMKAGKIILPADGEGRNVVYAATQGWEAHAFDLSENGQTKALKLAKSKEVDIHFFIADFSNPGIEDQYDVVSLIYAHMPKEVRAQGFEHLKQYLKPGGTLIVEAFTPEHLALNSPFGPKNVNMLYTKEELKSTFSSFDIRYLEESQIDLDEGRHAGSGIVVRMIAVK